MKYVTFDIKAFFDGKVLVDLHFNVHTLVLHVHFIQSIGRIYNLLNISFVKRKGAPIHSHTYLSVHPSQGLS